MAACVQNWIWIVRVSGHALRPYKRPCTEVFKDILDMCVVVYLGSTLTTQRSTSNMYARSCDAFVQAIYTSKPRSALSAWTRRAASVSILALTAFEWTPRRSSHPRLADTTKKYGRPIVPGFRKLLQTVYRLVLR